MPYMLLIHEEIGQRDTRTEEEGQAVYARMVDFGMALKNDGLLLAMESLASQNTAAKVTVAAGKPRIVDGPFAEAKEMVGGFFLVDVATREEALEIAARCPAAEWATVEVRGLGPCFAG